MLRKTVKVNYPFFKVVADGGMSLPIIGEGRFIPSIMIDIEDNVEVAELLKLHENTPPGDTVLQWSLPDTIFRKPKSVFLNLTFLKPMEMSFGIDFSIAERHALVDGIIQSRAFILQVGKRGEKVSTLFIDESKQQTNSSVLIEVPNTGFDSKWNELLLDYLKHKYRKKGTSRKEASEFAKEQISKMREIWNMRRPG